MEYAGGLFILCVMALIILVVLGPQIQQARDQLMQSLQINQFEPVDEAYLAERAAMDAEDAAYLASLEPHVYSDLPLTQHAQAAHAGETWHAATIVQAFDEGKCTPQIYSCDKDDFEVHHCELHPGKSIALLIGKTVRAIITGFMADTPYWTNRCGMAQ